MAAPADPGALERRRRDRRGARRLGPVHANSLPLGPQHRPAVPNLRRNARRDGARACRYRRGAATQSTGHRRADAWAVRCGCRGQSAATLLIGSNRGPHHRLRCIELDVSVDRAPGAADSHSAAPAPASTKPGPRGRRSLRKRGWGGLWGMAVRGASLHEDRVQPIPSYVVSIDLTDVSKPDANVCTSRSTTRPAVLYVVSMRLPPTRRVR